MHGFRDCMQKWKLDCWESDESVRAQGQTKLSDMKLRLKDEKWKSQEGGWLEQVNLSPFVSAQRSTTALYKHVRKELKRGRLPPPLKEDKLRHHALARSEV